MNGRKDNLLQDQKTGKHLKQTAKQVILMFSSYRAPVVKK